MLRNLLLAVATLIATMGLAFAQVDVNKADQAALDGVKGIGPAISKAIIDERKKGGNFKDWADFRKRVKGVGEANSSKLSQAGLTVNGQVKPNTPAATKTARKTAATAPKVAKSEAKPEPRAGAKSETKTEAKAGAKQAKPDGKQDQADAVRTEPKK